METVDVPFVLPVIFIDDLVEGMAMEMAEAVPETDLLKVDLFQRWVKERAKQSISSVRVHRAATQVNLSDVEAW